MQAVQALLQRSRLRLALRGRLALGLKLAAQLLQVLLHTRRTVRQRRLGSTQRGARQCRNDSA